MNKSQKELVSDYETDVEKTRLNEIISDTFALLESEGKRLIGSNGHSIEDDDFRENLDGIEHHNQYWHQWGIVTHTRKVFEMLEGEASEYITQWGVRQQVDEHMSQQVDPNGQFSKWDLFKMSIPPHDLGKFASRVIRENQGLRDHVGHEKISGDEVANRNGAFWKYYASKGLTDLEIEYIAQLAAKHFELDKIRKKAKKSQVGYSIEYAEGLDFITDSQTILEENSNIAFELGLWFLVDSLAKTDLVIQVKTDVDIARMKPVAEQLVQQKIQDGEVLDSRLTQAVLQRPVNIAVAQRFLIELCR